MIRNGQKGFTLIEILIVVAIIAILASVVLVGLGPTQQAGRDARRISDLREVQNGLELYYNKCGYYPGGAQAAATCGAYGAIAPITTYLNWTGAFTTALTGSAIGVNNVPSDPTAGKGYQYGAAAGGTGYVLAAQLENLSNSALQTSINATTYTITCSRATGLYCVQL